MDIKDSPDHQEEIPKVAVTRDSQGRRRFLTSASAGLAVTTLAARPVWGSCTISGAMSGGSIRAGEDVIDDCHYNGGALRSPGFWKDLQAGAVRDLFDIPKNGYKNRKNPAIIERMEDIEAVKAANSFFIPSIQVTVGVAAALGDPGGLDFNLAAIWLDAYYGFTPGNPPGVDTSGLSPEDYAQAWVTHFDGLAYLDPGVFNAVFD